VRARLWRQSFTQTGRISSTWASVSFSLHPNNHVILTRDSLTWLIWNYRRWWSSALPSGSQLRTPWNIRISMGSGGSFLSRTAVRFLVDLLP
jgi:hypothetical protein